jgi:hypothetical protein
VKTSEREVRVMMMMMQKRSGNGKVWFGTSEDKSKQLSLLLLLANT